MGNIITTVYGKCGVILGCSYNLSSLFYLLTSVFLGTSGTRILQHVTVPIVSGEECFAAYSRVRGAAFLARGSDHVICAGLREGGKDACLVRILKLAVLQFKDLNIKA